MASAALRLPRSYQEQRTTVALSVGRLLEIRVVTPIRSADDVEELAEILWSQLAGCKERVVICADYRNLDLLAPDRAEEWGALMTSVSRLFERSAILLDPAKATANLQMQRIIDGVGNPTRRAFTDEKALQRYLRGILNEDERYRLASFLLEGERLFKKTG